METIALWKFNVNNCSFEIYFKAVVVDIQTINICLINKHRLHNVNSCSFEIYFKADVVDIQKWRQISYHHNYHYYY